MTIQPVPIGHYYPDVGDPQSPADVGVIITTIRRPEIVRAIESVFRQTLPGRIQLMIGIDKAAHAPVHLDAVLARRPPNVSAVILEPPYSTSARHGGVHTALDGGAMRTLLSFLANARHVAYLDDDNEYEPEHLEELLAAVQGFPWAYSQRLLIREETDEVLGVDVWDSVGPDRGRFADQGGFVDTNCLMVDKLSATPILGRWAESGTGKPGLTADRYFFTALRRTEHGRLDKPTVRYRIRATNVLHGFIRDKAEF